MLINVRENVLAWNIVQRAEFRGKQFHGITNLLNLRGRWVNNITMILKFYYTTQWIGFIETAIKLCVTRS